MVKKCYVHEVEQTARDVMACGGDLVIALAADSHLDNSVPTTVENIAAVDQRVHFDCCIHLGDFLAGKIGRLYARVLLRQQLEQFSHAVASGRFFPVQGNHDEHCGQCSEQFWVEATDFLNAEKDVCRVGQKPYYYVDIEKQKVRLVFLDSYYFERQADGMTMVFGYEEGQIEWLQNQALRLPADWTVMLFSHDAPFSELEEETAMTRNAIRNGNRVFQTIDQCRKKYGFSLAGWFIGHYHGDRVTSLFGVNFIICASQTAYDPQLFDDDVRFWERELGTVSEDLWDALVLNRREHRIYLKRFGAGEDRTVEYE